MSKYVVADEVVDTITENLVAAYKIDDRAVPSLRIIVTKLLADTPEQEVADVLNDFIYDLLEPHLV